MMCGVSHHHYPACLKRICVWKWLKFHRNDWKFFCLHWWKTCRYLNSLFCLAVITLCTISILKFELHYGKHLMSQWINSLNIICISFLSLLLTCGEHYDSLTVVTSADLLQTTRNNLTCGLECLTVVKKILLIWEPITCHICNLHLPCQ